MASVAPWQAPATAAELEQLGFDGMVLTDSQSFVGDCFTALALAAAGTRTLRLAPGVTNPVTRHPAVLASTIATLHAVSGGRAVLGVGRGSSALSSVGLAPTPPAVFESLLDVLQRHLRGEAVPFEQLPEWMPAIPRAAADGESRLSWLGATAELGKVPLDVAATGSRVLAIGARQAERLTLQVGADPARVASALETARDAREQAGLDPGGISFGAYVNVVVDDDVARAQALGAGRLAGTLSLNRQRGARPDDPAVAARFGVFGPPEHCAERMRELMELGVSRFVVIPPGQPQDATLRRLVEDVLPALA